MGAVGVGSAGQCRAGFMQQKVAAPALAGKIGGLDDGQGPVRSRRPEGAIVKLNLGCPKFVRQKGGKGRHHLFDRRQRCHRLHGDRARPARAPAARDAVTVALDHPDLVEGNAGPVGQELGIDRFMPLPVRLRADKQQHRAIGREFHPHAFRGIAQNGFDVAAQAKAPQLAARRTFGAARGEPVKVGFGPGAGQHAGKIAHVDIFACGAGIGEVADEIRLAQGQRIGAQLAGGLIHRAFDGIDRFGPARAAIGIDRGGIGVDTLCGKGGHRNIVDARQHLGKKL